MWTFYIYSLLRFFKFPYNFCRDFRHTCNPRDNYMHFTGYVLRHRDPWTFYGGKICSVVLTMNCCFLVKIVTHNFIHSILKSWFIRALSSYNFLVFFKFSTATYELILYGPVVAKVKCSYGVHKFKKSWELYSAG